MADTRDAILGAFRTWDTNGNGTITLTELKHALKLLDPQFSDATLNTLVGQFSGPIDYYEFVDFLTGGKAEKHAIRGTRLKGKVAIVTGAGSSGPGWGVGKAIAVAMAREGAKVGLVDLNTAAAEETAAIIQSEGGICSVLPKCDVSKIAEVEKMVAACENDLGGVTTLINNVGLVCPGDVTSVPLGKWDLINNINLVGAYNCTKACLPSFLRLGKGKGCSVVNISSVSSIRALRSECAYACSKAGMNALTHAVAREFAGQGIRCNCVLPGLIETPLVANAYKGADFEKIMAERHAQSPTGKMGDAWDIAHACVYFGADESSYANGVVMAVDGGFSMQVLPNSGGMPLLRPPSGEPVAIDFARRLAGKVAIVTGTSFTSAIAKVFKDQGATVFVVGAGADCDCDLTSADAVEAMVNKCVDAHGGVDMLVNGPGIDCCKGVETLSSEEFASVYRRNTMSVLLTMRFAIPKMLERASGAIVNFSAMAGLKYTQPEPAIAAASGSVNTLTVQTAAEFAPRGIRVNGLVPFVLDKTSVMDGFAYDVANACLHLCSEESRYTNGQVITVDLAQASRVSVKL